MLFDPCFERYDLGAGFSIDIDMLKSKSKFLKQMEKNYKYGNNPKTLMIISKRYLKVITAVHKATRSKSEEDKKVANQAMDDLIKFLETFKKEAKQNRSFLINTPIDNLDIDLTIGLIKIDFAVYRRLIK